MLIVKDQLEEGKNVDIIASSQMFKVLDWKDGCQLVCKLTGGEGVRVYRRVIWCAGELLLAKDGKEFVYSGDGGVSLETLSNRIILYKFEDNYPTIVAKKEAVVAVPENYTVSESTEDGCIAISGTGVVPMEIKCPAEDLVYITISENDVAFVEFSRLLCWTAGLTREIVREPTGLCRFSGSGIVVFCKSH